MSRISSEIALRIYYNVVTYVSGKYHLVIQTFIKLRLVRVKQCFASFPCNLGACNFTETTQIPINYPVSEINGKEKSPESKQISELSSFRGEWEAYDQ